MAQTLQNFVGTYINSLLDEAGFAGASEETRNQFVPQLSAEAERRLGLAIIKELPQEKVEEFTKLFEKNNVDETALVNFLTIALPNYADLANTVLLDFKEEFKKVLAELK